MLKFILYMLLAVVILSGGIFKTFAINYGISKYLSKKPYKGDFEFKKSCVTYFENELYFVGISCFVCYRCGLQYIELLKYSRKFSRIDFRIFYCTCNISFRSMVQYNR